MATSPWQPVSVATRARKARTDVDLDGQLDLFDGVPNMPPPKRGDQQERRNGDVETSAAEIATRANAPG
jgi:hypothetical protein